MIARDPGVVVPGEVSVDMKAVIARREAIVAGSRKGVEGSLRSDPNITVFIGTAAFESPSTVRVGEDILEADHVFLNVGGRASVPDLPSIRDVPYLTNTTLLKLDCVPKPRGSPKIRP